MQTIKTTYSNEFAQAAVDAINWKFQLGEEDINPETGVQFTPVEWAKYQWQVGILVRLITEHKSWLAKRATPTPDPVPPPPTFEDL